MLKKIFTLSLITYCTSASAQSVIDTVALGPSYANQIWYSLANDNQASASKSNWDLAFETSGQGSSIFINSVTGTTLWQYPKADTSGWNTLDTAGMSNWSKRWNADSSWSLGALGRSASPSNPFDLDWGIYSSITHIVTGDSLYVIKLANGSFKKLQIRNLASGTYNFRYADLNGSNLQNASLAKSAFTGQNLGYYSIQNNATITREPASANWDLLFTQYTTFIPGPYTVSGIIQNKGVSVAKVKPIANASTYKSWAAHSYKAAINIIGYDWKNFINMTYIIEDSLVYFIKSKSGDIWKLVPTGFGGSANGNNIFTKEKLSSVGISEGGEVKAAMAVYPNPSNGSNITLVLSGITSAAQTTVMIMDLSGAIVSQEIIETDSSDLQAIAIQTQHLPNGVYFVSVATAAGQLNQKLIINNN